MADMGRRAAQGRLLLEEEEKDNDDDEDMPWRYSLSIARLTTRLSVASLARMTDIADELSVRVCLEPSPLPTSTTLCPLLASRPPHPLRAREDSRTVRAHFLMRSGHIPARMLCSLPGVSSSSPRPLTFPPSKTPSPHVNESMACF